MTNSLADFITKFSGNKTFMMPVFLSKENLREAFLPEYSKVLAEEYRNNEALGNLDTQQGKGSNPFISGLAKKILAPYRIRPAISADNRDRKISAMIKGKYYTDFGDLVVHSPKHTYTRNKSLLKDLIETVESKVDSVQFPFKVTGMVPEIFEECNEEGYGLRFVPAEDFDYVSDKRLNLPNGTKFNNVDEKGIIIPSINGSRAWYSNQDGLSRLCLYYALDLGAHRGVLDFSDIEGRIVLVDAEGASSQ